MLCPLVAAGPLALVHLSRGQTPGLACSPGALGVVVVGVEEAQVAAAGSLVGNRAADSPVSERVGQHSDHWAEAGTGLED